jgi:glycosyltransferase involved in cell wall biosynthesis
MFSVIINNYNYANYIAEAIDSVLGQIETDFELIIVDDGSSDGSQEIIDGYDDTRIQVIHKSNGGQASAFNVGVEVASGEWICFLDSDDIWREDKLGLINQRIANLPENVSMVVHSLKGIDAEGADYSLGDTKLPNYQYLDAMKWMGMTNNLPPCSPTSGMCIKASVLKKCMPIDESVWRIAADVPLIIFAAVEGELAYMQEKLGSYRIHGTNLWAPDKNDEYKPLRNITMNYNAAALLNDLKPGRDGAWVLNPFRGPSVTRGMAWCDGQQAGSSGTRVAHFVSRLKMLVAKRIAGRN